MTDRTPRAIPKHVRANFSTLRQAAKQNNMAAVSAIRKSDGKNITLICAMQTNDDGTLTPVPFAEMIEGNPFEMYEDPTK